MNDPTAHRTDEPDPEGEARRERSRAGLPGFRVAGWLPTTHHRAGIGGKLRPVEEIARRVMGIQVLNLWVLATKVSDEQLLAYIESNDLGRTMTDEERAMIDGSRDVAARERGDRMGWTQENMWPLAWALGFEQKPEPTAPLIDGTVVGPMLELLPRHDGIIAELLERADPRSEADVLDLEDLFYCAHNATRSAQNGDPSTVPPDFHPIRNGGAVHERRHALTWMITPGVSWEDADLST